MVRSRSAAAKAVASRAPHESRRRLSSLLLLTLLVAVAGCSSAAARDEPSNLSRPDSRAHSSTVVGGTGKTRSDTSGTNPGTKGKGSDQGKGASRTGGDGDTSPTAAARIAAVEDAWASSKNEFYKAALLGAPTYPPYLTTLVRGGPVYDSSVAYLSALIGAGLVGPTRWRVGNARVVALGPSRAQVEGCLWDTGSVWKSSGDPGPSSLGGGTGFTASDAILTLEGGRWLVLEDDVSAVGSPKEAGPCHGF